MQCEKFQTGDIVRLRSGGPLMVVLEKCLSWTIAWVEETVRTIWFDRSQKSHEAEFPMSALERIQSEVE